jgi:predicted transcriptional regulator of viral defense system
MNHMERLADLIRQNQGLIKTSQVEEAGIPRKYLSLMARVGKLECLSQGVYLSPDAFEDRLYRLQQRCRSGIYSHETALFMNDLSDREPMITMMTVQSGYNPHRLIDEPIKLFYIKRELHGLGETTMTTAFGREVHCYDRERTLCDMVRSRSQIDQALTNAAYKFYLRSKEKNISLLMRYSTKLGIQNLVRNYLEVLL